MLALAIVSTLALLISFTFAHAGVSNTLNARLKGVALVCALAVAFAMVLFAMVLATAEVWHIWALALH